MKINETIPVAKQFQRSLTNVESNKWGKPAFQAFQLRPWKDSDMGEEALKNQLGIYGPQSQIEMGRAKSVPPKGSKDPILDRDDVRTAHSVANMCDGSISLKPKASLEALPTRPPLSKMKQIPGRYFPKPTPIDLERMTPFATLKRNRHAIRIRNYDRPTGNSKSMDMNDLPVESVSFLDVLPKSTRQKSPGFGRLFHRMKTNHTEFPEIRSEVFAICFNANDSSRKGVGDHVSSTLHVSNETNNNNSNNTNNNNSNNNNSNNSTNGHIVLKATNQSFDPNSELRSDYYTIKRISVTSQSSRTPSRSFSVVLRGHPKRLHPKLMSDSGCDFGDDNHHHHHPQLQQAPKGSKSVSSSLAGGPGNQRETTVDSEKPTESIKPSEPRTPAKIEVKIDSSSALAPITINGVS